MPLFVTSAQTALSSARFGLILVVLTNRILSSYRKGFDIPANCNRSICAPYTILYIMYARTIRFPDLVGPTKDSPV